MCDLDTEENGYDYKCPKLSSDDYDELESPCDGCSHRCYVKIEIDDNPGNDAGESHCV